MKKYQTDYSRMHQDLYRDVERKIKSKKILAVLRTVSDLNLGDCRICEVGCSTGINSNFLAGYCKECFGVDIDQPALQYARDHSPGNSQFVLGDAMQVPFPDNSFDIVICNHVYEHVPDSQLLVNDIYRILKPGGYCYFAAGNKYNIVEAHYQLPFLSWLPKSLAHRYMRLCGRGTTYMENHLSYFELRRLVKGFHLTDYTLKIIRDPARYGAEDMIRPGSVIGKIPGCVLNAIRFLIPTFIFVLEKPHEVKK